MTGLRSKVRETLLDPALWRPVLEEYALAMELAVALTDARGHLLGECINPQPLWSLLRPHTAVEGVCVFCLVPSERCTAHTDALKKGELIITSNRLGLAHFVVPLSIGGERLGTLIAGQVLGQFPDRHRLELEQTARERGISAQEVWEIASRARPVTQKTLRTYGQLLSTLANTFINARYQALVEAGRLAELSWLHYQVQQSNRQVTDILESIGDTFVSVDREWRVVYANRHTLISVDLDRKQVLGKSFWEVFPYLTGTEAESQHRRAMTERVTLHFEVLDPGSGHWSEVSVYPSADGLSIYGRDVTERKQAERALQEAKRDAELANRLKDQFLATLSHELRTPLNPIVGFTQLLRRGTLSTTATAQALDAIERNAKAQVRLTDDLLDVSRIVTGKLQLRTRPLDLAGVVEIALDSIRPAAEVKVIALSYSCERTVGQVSGDSDRLQQVLWNLLSNAIKFTPDGGQVLVQLTRSGTQAEIRVSDSGCGIRAEFLPFVFERFRQADGSSTRSHNGLGLGLAIVRHLVEMHGGVVRVDSPGEGQGTTFTVRLPILTDSTASNRHQN